MANFKAMASVTFILKNPSSKSPTPIFMVFRAEEDRIKLAILEKVHPKDWNPKTRRARESRRTKERESLNTRLDDICEGAMRAYRAHLTANSGLIVDKLKSELQAVVRPHRKDDPAKMNLIAAIEQYIATVNRKPWTMKHYVTTQNVLKDFLTFRSKDLAFEDINIDFYEEFTGYLMHTRKFSLNTIGTQIKNIKVFMNYALDKGYTTSKGHLHKKFKTVEETADTIYLSDEELLKLYTLDLSNNKKLENQRDLFIIGAYTGLRFSDLVQLKSENIIKDGTRIRLKTQKTGEIVEIPLHWMIRKILEKYEWQLPRKISDQKMNDYIKEIGKLAQINDVVTKSMTRGGLFVQSQHEKWQLITVHTARRSFATNAYLSKIPVISIMKITGHRTEKAFMKYIKITQQQNADLLSSHPFFNTTHLKVVGN